MSQSSQHLYRCLDIMKADAELSEETKIIMFVEYGKLVLSESIPTNWIKYDWRNVETRPKKTGRYEVYRKSCNKQHYETWNGIGTKVDGDDSVAKDSAN